VTALWLTWVERTPFVFTKEMAAVFGGDDETNEQFRRFEDFCGAAFNVVRKHGIFLINIFMIMLSAGMTCRC
jgi:phosphatidylinositol-4,5-bisphosphate 3-kinase